MNLVQKLPIGLGLACMMMLSSCSTEDVQPVSGQEVEKLAFPEQTLKTRGYYMASSHGTVSGNVNSYSTLQGWQAYGLLGISNYQHILGDPSASWESPLPIVFPGPSTFVTLPIPPDSKAHSVTFMEGLVPGKKYKVTFSLSTSKRLGFQMPYAQNAEIAVNDS